jgi:hypothetical protein
VWKVGEVKLGTCPPRRLRVLLLALALAGVALGASACGGSPTTPSVAKLGQSGSTTTPPATSKSGTTGQGGGAPSGPSGQTMGMGGVTLAFSQCIQKHGFPNFPDPDAQGNIQASGIDPNSTAWQNAEKACQQYAGSSGKPPTAAQQQKMLANALKFSRCMRSHGVTDYPDPQTQAGGGISISIRVRRGSGSDLNPNSPIFQAAQRACNSILNLHFHIGGTRARV